ncbi:MAG: MFS transporter [Caldilineaceae bacterium]
MSSASITPLSRNVKLYLVIPFVLGFSWLGLFIVLFNLFLLRLGYGPRFIGLLSAWGPVMFIAMSIPGGVLSRRWGSRRLIILGVSIYAVSFTLLPWGELLSSPGREIWFVVFLLMAYLGGCFYWPNADVYLMQVTTADNRSRAFALQQALYPLAGFMGSLLAGQLPGVFARLLGASIEQPTPYRYALLLCGVAYIGGVLAMLATDADAAPPAPPGTPQANDGGKWPVLLGLIAPLALVEMLWKGGTQGPTRFFNIFLNVDLQVSPARIGLILGVGQLVAAALAMTTPWLARRLGNGRVIVLTLGGLSAVLLLMAVSRNWLGAGISFMLFQGLTAISISAIAIYRMERVDAAWWGWASGIAVAVRGIGESAVFFGGGMIIELYGFASFFTATAAVLAIGLTFFILCFRPLTRMNFMPNQTPS